jgi:dynein heavy chain
MSVMSTRIQEVYSLSAWYQDVLRRYEQLAAWTSGSQAAPHSVWLSGLFNPKAFLTAVRPEQLRQRLGTAGTAYGAQCGCG